MRPSGRNHDSMREVDIDLDFTKHADGSVLISVGDTKVLCTCTIEDKVPPFLNHMNQGWVTAEYGMLPSATNTRSAREAARGNQTGRTMRNPASDRPLVALHCGPLIFGDANAGDRLRCDPGGRGDSNGIYHRRVPCDVHGNHQTDE